MLTAGMNAAAQAGCMPDGLLKAPSGKVAPMVAAPSLRPEVYILVLQDEIARLKRWIDELVRMHYRLDERRE